jgi:hypothetical protein
MSIAEPIFSSFKPLLDPGKISVRTNQLAGVEPGDLVGDGVALGTFAGDVCAELWYAAEMISKLKKTYTNPRERIVCPLREGLKTERNFIK